MKYRPLLLATALALATAATLTAGELTDAEAQAVADEAQAIQKNIIANSDHPLEGQRLTQNWFFVKGDSSSSAAGAEKPVPPADTAAWMPITVPHTWNAIDGQSGGDYYRGPGWYRTTVDLPDLTDSHSINRIFTGGQRAYLRFEAVSTVADVYFNGHHLGTHRGGFNAFTFEITQFAHEGTNELLVRADNSPQPDIAPLSGDFTVFGGIYRPVHLIIKRATGFNLLDHGTSGIAIDQTSVTPERATIRVTATVHTTDPNGFKGVVDFVLLNFSSEEARTELKSLNASNHFPGGGFPYGPGGRYSYTGESQAVSFSLRPNETRAVEATITIKNPHLWQGVDDPHLYILTAAIYDDPVGDLADLLNAPGLKSIGCIVFDQQEWPVALRSIAIDPTRGFLLNGKPYKLHGVNRHQDRPGKGWAISDDDQAEDVRIMREMGVNAVRTAHYPQSETFYDLCQRAGILAWAEIPVVDTIGKPTDPAFADTTKTQLLENIRQRRNYANIFTWSLSNELYNKPTDDPAPLLTALNALAHKEDPYRPTTLAANHTDKAICTITDIFALNHYSGWYDKNIDSMPKLLADYNALGNHRGLGVSEYGAGASIRQHELGMTRPPKTAGPWHPEEWQSIVHEKIYPIIDKTDYCWGSFLWVMFDFASAKRNEGDTPGRNDKGLVTYDRQTRKDAFYYYKANWSNDDVLYITSRRYTERKDAHTEVKAYANISDNVLLTINGHEIGYAKPDAYHICRWKNVTLSPGKNEIIVAATREDRYFRDTCTWTLAPAPDAGAAD